MCVHVRLRVCVWLGQCTRRCSQHCAMKTEKLKETCQKYHLYGEVFLTFLGRRQGKPRGTEEILEPKIKQHCRMLVRTEGTMYALEVEVYK